MNICVVCKRVFDPPKDYPEKRTCSKECYAIHMRSLVSSKFLKNSFKKGDVPFNKGIARNEWMSEKSIEKCKATYINKQEGAMSIYAKQEGRFLPHNTLQKGTVTRRKHIHNKGKNKGKVEIEYFINIDWKGNRKPNNSLKRYIWEVYHQQDVPKGYVVHCIDNNPENLDVDNLELISRGQLAVLNKTRLYR